MTKLFSMIKKMRYTLCVFVALCIFTDSNSLFGQDYTFTLTQRRAYDRIKVEIWARTENATAPRLGNASLVLQYNTDFLYPSLTQELAIADSIMPIETNSPNPYIEINSNFNSANGYNALVATSYSAGFYSLEISQQQLGLGGLQPQTTGKGSLLGVLSFDIIGNPDETATAGIIWSQSEFPGKIEVFDFNGNDIKANITFTDPPAFTVLGITILSPNINQQVVDRDANYQLLEGLYADGGYPIYFERSINPALYTSPNTTIKTIDNNLAYVLEYSLDNETTWSEAGRFAETDKTASTGKSETTFSGNIFEPKAAAYWITAANGQQLSATTFRQPVRVIWNKDQFFSLRSEQGKLRITQLAGISDISIINRNKSAITATNNGILTIGRLFFVQLDGANTYMRTSSNYSNATQLTVSAWVNLNAVQVAGSSPAIVASSGGPSTAAIDGSNEGAWMLYLQDGNIPAFRAREILSRGNPGTESYLAIVSGYALNPLPAVPSDALSAEHANNWVHIAATVKDNVVCLYLNGELINKVTNNNAPNIRMLTTQHPIWIGVNPNTAVTPESFLNAGIKQVQVWRTALTQDQIRLYAAGIVNADSIATSDDVRKSLEFYWTLEGTIADLASNATYQNSRSDILFHNDAFAGQLPPPAPDPEPVPGININSNSNNTIEDNTTNLSSNFSKKGSVFLASPEVQPSYRPDQPHLLISSPAIGAGVKNKLGDNTEIRWVTYGMTDLTKNTNLNFELEYSIDNGETWTICKNPAGQNLTGNNISSNGTAIWQPYQNNVANANLRTISPYTKTAQVRLKGLDANNNVALMNYSQPFTIAPYFSIAVQAGSQLATERRVGMNISGNYAYIEAWIRPYQFPAAGTYYVIAEKSDATALHYSFRLNDNGTLSLLLQAADALPEDLPYTATTTADLSLVEPNSVKQDSAWTHVAVLFIKSNANGLSEARFFVDGNMQIQEYPATIQLNTQNDYPLYIASNQVATSSLVGEVREVRFWNNIPNDYSISGAEPTEFTNFVQKAQTEGIKDLTNANNKNLHSYFTLDGGTFFTEGTVRVAAYSDINGAILQNFNETVSYTPFYPFIKLVEPSFNQRVSNSNKEVRVRWVGMYYNGTNFTAGIAKTPPSLEFSIRGGGGGETQPYQYVGSTYHTGNKVNSIKLLQTSQYYSDLTTSPKYFALALDASMANPDVNNDNIFTDQGSLAPTLTNGRFRLTGSYMINDETGVLQTEGPLFTINPPSNFTARVMLEGYHQGNAAGKAINQLATDYNSGGLRLRLYSDNSGEIGTKVGPDAFSSYGYAERDPAHLNKGNFKFGNVDFMFTDIANGSYWLLLEHINHLPIMSRYPAPFQFTGDAAATWVIESGWDFMSWNGVDDNVMPNPNADIWSNGYYSARGTALNSPASNPDRYSTTGLIHNGGTTAASSLAAMVGGDVNQDLMINAADRVKVREDEGTQSYQSDITGDRYVNAVDRTITDKNYGKVSSLLDVVIPPMAPPAPFNAIVSNNPELSNYFNFMAEYIKNEDLTQKNNNSISKSEEFIFYKVESNNAKGVNKFQALTYTVSATATYNDSGYIDVNMFIENKGDAFAPANCTFAISYDPKQLEFNKLLKADSVIFNSSFDYNNLNRDNIPTTSYLKLSSAPNATNNQAYDNIRTIEIDYDAFANIGGINVPSEPTFLGTLRFKTNNNTAIAEFNWHESKAVITTTGENITDKGNWVSLPNILMYNGNVISPNGNETYSVLAPVKIRFKTSKEASVYIEFSSNHGLAWQRISGPDAINTTTTENIFSWTTPDLVSNGCLIRILDAKTLTEIDRSDAIFSIQQPIGTIYSPYASSTPYKGAATTKLEWFANGTDCVKFEYSTDNGITWSSIKGTFNANASKANWVVPKITTKEALVRMLDCNSNKLLATSGRFMILGGSITFTAPMQGQRVKSNTNLRIRWNRNSVDLFDLEVSLDGGFTWELVDIDIDASAGYYDWITPEIKTDSAIFRALYQSDPSLEYGKSRRFTILGTTFIESPDSYLISEVFPNPVSNKTNIKFNLDVPTAISIDIIDISGALIKNLIKNNIIEKQILELDITGLPAGKYYLLINTDKGHITREIIRANN